MAGHWLSKLAADRVSDSESAAEASIIVLASDHQHDVSVEVPPRGLRFVKRRISAARLRNLPL